MHNWKRWFGLGFLLLILVACTEDAPPTPRPEEPNDPAPSETIAPANTTTPGDKTAVEPTASSQNAGGALPNPTTPPNSANFTWPPPPTAYSNFSRAPVTSAEQTTFTALEANYPPERDDVRLAVAYRGYIEEETAVSNPILYTVGDREPLNILNIDTITFSSPDFELLHISKHAYFWFDTTPGLSFPSEQTLIQTGIAFDEIYEQDTRIFGMENSPGIDGDPRIHIVNASPVSVCDVTVSTTGQCGLGGYFGSSDILPQGVDPSSNEREMFVMNGSLFSSSSYLDILAHEFRHMIEANYDANDWDWEVEGSAMLAEDLLGFPNDPISRGNAFLSNPDQQLNRWTDGYSIPYYGQGYVINRYIYNRLGEKLYRDFATHPDPGFAAIDDIAAKNSLDFDGMSIFLDWLVALAIHDDPNAPAIYKLRDGLGTAAFTGVNNFPTSFNTTVSQYAADYYQLSGNGNATLNFTGSNHVPLIQVLPRSGQHMWLANRANYSNMRLTREFDLSSVNNATLEYAVFHEIELSYDFAYVSISTDGGQTWQGLEGKNMQGTEFFHDSADAAYTDRFYTDNSGGWVKESIDLSAYTGQTVQIRFEYVTDPILTFGGIAFDNIAIPEIGFFDDAEGDAGWLAEGFVRATGYVPQRWHVLLVTYESGAPLVTEVELAADNTATAQFSLASVGGKRPFLIIAATSPMTLEPAHYQLELTQ